MIFYEILLVYIAEAEANEAALFAAQAKRRLADFEKLVRHDFKMTPKFLLKLNSFIREADQKSEMVTLNHKLEMEKLPTLKNLETTAAG